MKNIKSWTKKNGYFIAIFLVLFLFIFSDFIFLNKEYNIGFDTKNHFVTFYTEFKRLFTSGEMPFWSFNFFLGTNIIASKSYYFISDFFAYIIFIFKNTEILDVMLVMQFFKCLTAFYLMNSLLKEFNFKPNTRLICSLLYTFSSFTFIFLGIPMFLSFAAFLPLLFISIEKYLKEKTCWLISLSSFLLICSSYYLFWSISIFLLIYWPLRYFLTNPLKKWKNFILSSVWAILFYILGALLYAPVLLPTVHYMLNNSRVNSTASSGLFWNKKIYLDMFIKAISTPFYVNTEIPNYFGTEYYRTDQIALFTSSLTVLLLPQIIALKQTKKRNIYCIFYLICFLLLLFEPGGSLMHGFAEASFRWTNFIILVNLIILADILDNHELNKPILILTFIGLLVGVGIVFIVVGNPFDYLKQTTVILISLGFALVYLLINLFIKKPQMILLSFILIEILFSGKITLKSYIEKNSQTSYHYESLGIPFDYFEKLQEKSGNEFYRIYFNEFDVDIDHQKDFNYNSNMIYNYKGVYGYDSTYQTTVDEFLDWTGQYFWWFNETDMRILDFLSVKYYVVKSAHDLPHENFIFIEQIGNSEYSLYENQQYKPFGFTCNSLISKDVFYEYNNIFEIYYLIGNSVIVEQSDIDNYNLTDYIHENETIKSLSLTSFSNNHIEGTIELEDKQLLMLTVPYDKGWNIKVNDKKVEPIIANGGFMLLPLSEGKHVITFDFVPYGWNTGLIISRISFISIIILMLIRKKKLNS